MKIAELVSALEELGTIYRHTSKNEPKPCIAQVLALLKGKGHLHLSDLKSEALLKKKPAPKKPAKAKASAFDHETYLTRLLTAKTEDGFVTTLEDIKRAKAKKADLIALLAAYTGLPSKSSRTIDQIYAGLLNAFKAEARHDARAAVSRTMLPI